MRRNPSNQNRSPFRRPAVGAALLLAMLTLGSVATADQSRQPIYLDSDTAELDNTTGTSVYTGDVVMTQGVRRVTGDKMTVYTTENRQVRRIVVEGRPAVWIERPAEEGELLKGEAPRMEYHAQGPERVMLFEGGTVTQGRNTVTGETVEYDLETEIAKARGKDSRERTRITFFPEDDNGDE
ncbi:lipopolysaccharide transport periplasmic protein LptA [Methylonatrum kenyense]|uniref:lipopolysaccharide transport periplasmic protein LptA n=1 Tax=Methylonatrum kenyense TaxID=455253 RepID=UPI0020BE239A|nr:lipopolysaccharide transport periplasmic protein LptA [Methylonatrum kenyense]MCK8516259.1 lipopolysaccharide transport periplasmic protein LptA [Methylonatrum kenyense]